MKIKLILSFNKINDEKLRNVVVFIIGKAKLLISKTINVFKNISFYLIKNMNFYILYFIFFVSFNVCFCEALTKAKFEQLHNKLKSIFAVKLGNDYVKKNLEQFKKFFDEAEKYEPNLANPISPLSWVGDNLNSLKEDLEDTKCDEKVFLDSYKEMIVFLYCYYLKKVKCLKHDYSKDLAESSHLDVFKNVEIPHEYIVDIESSVLGGFAQDVVDKLTVFKYSEYNDPKKCTDDLNSPNKENWNKFAKKMIYENLFTDYVNLNFYKFKESKLVSFDGGDEFGSFEEFVDYFKYDGTEAIDNVTLSIDFYSYFKNVSSYKNHCKRLYLNLLNNLVPEFNKMVKFWLLQELDGHQNCDALKNEINNTFKEKCSFKDYNDFFKQYEKLKKKAVDLKNNKKNVEEERIRKENEEVERLKKEIGEGNKKANEELDEFLKKIEDENKKWNEDQLKIMNDLMKKTTGAMSELSKIENEKALKRNSQKDVGKKQEIGKPDEIIAFKDTTNLNDSFSQKKCKCCC